jgi:hypothetical protein
MGHASETRSKIIASRDALQPLDALGLGGLLIQMMVRLAGADAEPKTLIIDATYFKANRTASSLRAKKGILGG